MKLTRVLTRVMLIYCMTNIRKKSVLAVLFLTLMFCVFGYSGIAQNASSASAVIHAKGVFRDKGNKQWQESSVNGKSRFNFVETSRSNNAVFLFDSSRNVKIELNVVEQMIYYSDTNNTRVALYPIVLYLTSGNSNYYRIRSGQKCLQAVELEGRGFSPELMDCTLSASQQWNILERNIGGITSYRLRNLLTQMRQTDLCLTAAALRTPVTMNRCDTSDPQRWVNLKLNTSTSFTNVRTLAVSDTICLGTQYSTDGAPRYRQDEDGILQRDTEFRTLLMAYCDERSPSGNSNNAAWAIQLL